MLGTQRDNVWILSGQAGRGEWSGEVGCLQGVEDSLCAAIWRSLNNGGSPLVVAPSSKLAAISRKVWLNRHKP